MELIWVIELTLGQILLKLRAIPDRSDLDSPVKSSRVETPLLAIGFSGFISRISILFYRRYLATLRVL